MESAVIQNRKGLAIAIDVRVAKPQHGLAFVMHGLGGFKDQVHIQDLARAFEEKNFTTVLFDTTNSFGESEGRYEDATITNYYQDLEDVIAWSTTQPWYQEPFVLSGHSLGGICTALFAESFPKRVLALAPISPVVSGALSVEAHQRYEPEEFRQWQTTGWAISNHRSKPGAVKRLPWSHIEDRLTYDLLPRVANLTMPVLLIVGEKDTSTPPDHVKILYNALPGPKEFHVIPNAPHSSRDPEHLAQTKTIIQEWIEKNRL